MTGVFPRGVRGIALVLGVVAGLACKPNTRDNPDVCNPDAAAGDLCAVGHCNPDTYMCEMNGGGGGTVLGASGGAGGPGGAGGQAAGGTGQGAGGAAGQGTASGGTAGGGGNGGLAAGGGAGGGGPQCTDDMTQACPLEKPLCLDGTCVACKDDGSCKDTTPICSPQKTCVSCVGAASNACASHPVTPVCATDGALKGACVSCASNTDCMEPQAPFCSSMNACVSCAQAGGASVCAALKKNLPFCATTGSQTGMCVECNTSSDCDAASNRPFCSATGVCVGCDKAVAPDTCKNRVPDKAVCGPAGACVQCVANRDCMANTAPVCSSANTCGPCAGDTDCGGGRPGPGVCMSHQDGRCASDSETIYVQNAAATCSESGMGSSTAPFCSMQPAVAAVGSIRDLIVVRGTVTNASSPFSAGPKQLSVVGQSSAVIATIHLAAGDAYLRDIKLGPSPGIGVQADSGSTLRLNHVVVTGNASGGVLVDGAAFDIRNTVVTGNGPGTTGAITWGGILLSNPPAAGPKQLNLVTVQNNLAPGIACSTVVSGTGVLASGNASVDIGPTCMFSSCGTGTATCGAQP